MKKAKRILSFLMAIVIMSSVLSVAASAKAEYKDAAISQYDDFDKPSFTLNQLSSMVLDYVDKMLAEKNADGSLIIDLSVLGELNLGSIDSALDGIYGLLNGAAFTMFKGLLGDLKDLKKDAIASARRRSTPAATADLNVIRSLIQFLSDNRAILSKVVDGSLNMGIANSFVDLSEINVNQMIKEALFEAAYPDTPVPEPVTQTVDELVQALIDGLIAENLPGLAGKIDFANSTAMAYDFIDNLLVDAYNGVLVDLLNTDVKKIIRELCGVVYDPNNPDDPGDESNLNEYAQVLNINYVVPEIVLPAGTTFIANLNNILAELVSVMTVNYTAWVAGDNSNLLGNVAAAAKYVLALTDSSFFAPYVAKATAAELNAMSNQQLFAYVVRSGLNTGVDNMNIPASADTLTKVAWYAVREVMANLVPQFDYSAQPMTLDGVLFMLADLIVYALNKAADLNPNAGVLPGEGLLAYGQGLDATLLAAVDYIRINYGGLLNLTLSTTDAFAALDTIIFSIIQTNWLPASVNGSTRELIINRLLRDILELNIDNVLALFERRADSELNSKTFKKILVDVVARLINIIFPNAMQLTYTSLEQALSNAELKGVVERLLLALNNRKDQILPALLPVLAEMMDLSIPQQFEAPEIKLPRQIGSATTFTISNESMGLNTAFTDKDGNFAQDSLYKIQIVSLTSSLPAINLSNLAGTVINGGDSVNCNVSGTFTANSLLMVEMTYDVYTELGTKLTEFPLTTRAFAYISAAVDDGAQYQTIASGNNNKHSMVYRSLYVNQNASMKSLEGLQAGVKRESATIAPDATVSRTAATVNAALAGVTPAPFTNITTTKDGGSWYFGLYSVADGAERPADGAYSSTFTFNATRTQSLGGSAATFALLNKSYVVFYNDYDLPGLFNSELNKRREQSNYYGDIEWNDYIQAMTAAMSLVYRPRQASTFMTQVAPAFLPTKDALVHAIEDLEATAKPSSVDGLRVAIDAFRPDNTGKEWDDPAFKYFGEADFVYYNYAKFEDEEGRAVGIWDSQQQEEPPVVLPADVAYALHRLNLYGSRLVSVQATKARLAEAIAFVGNPDESLYTPASWADFARAKAFAVAVNAEDPAPKDANGWYVLRQSKVDKARFNLVTAYKKLLRIADYTQLDAYIAEAQTKVEDEWTPDTWAALQVALTAATDVVRNMSATLANQAIIDAAAAALRAAIDALEAAGDPILAAPGFATLIDLVDGWVYGLTSGLVDVSAVAGPGYTVTFHNGSGGSGTGSYFRSVRNSDPSVVRDFVNIVFGDINGDGNIDSLDSALTSDYENFFISWDDPSEECFRYAADANADYNIDSMDGALIVDEENFMSEIDQFTSRGF